MSEDEHLQRAAQMRAGYQLWLEGIARLDCRCVGAGTCDPCRAGQALAAMGEMEAARRRRPLTKKPGRRKKGAQP